MTLLYTALRTAMPHPMEDAISWQVHTSFEAPAEFAVDWDRFVLESGGDIYSSYNWCRIWWKHYGQDRQLRILVFRRGERIVGLLPMMIDELGVGPLSVRLAKPVSSDSTIAVFRLPLHARWGENVLALAVSTLIERDGCDAVWFGPLSGEGTQAETIRRVGDRLSASVRVVRDAGIGVHIVSHLPNDVEAYYLALPYHERRNYRRRLNKLKKDYAVEFREYTDPQEIERQFPDFERMHEAYYTQHKRLGHFRDWPRSREFTLDLLKELAPSGQAHLQALRVSGAAITYEMSFSMGSSSYWRLGSRAPQSIWDPYSLGTLSAIEHFESSIRHGTLRVEAGPGRYEYKVRLGGTEYPLRSIVLAASRPWSRLKTRLLTLWADALHLAYYRMWFSRLAPRLPLRRGSLWKCWIRSRL